MIKPTNLMIVALLSLIILAQEKHRADGQSQYPVDTCPSGKYGSCRPLDTAGSSTVAPECVDCPRGSASIVIKKYVNSNWDKSYSVYSCAPCEQGTYANRTGSEFCDECPLGYLCPDPAQDPQPCPKGFYCSTIETWRSYGIEYSAYSVPNSCSGGDLYANKEASTECTPCPAGYDCTDPTIEPVKCPKG